MPVRKKIEKLEVTNTCAEPVTFLITLLYLHDWKWYRAKRGLFCLKSSPIEILKCSKWQRKLCFQRHQHQTRLSLLSLLPPKIHATYFSMERYWNRTCVTALSVELLMYFFSCLILYWQGRGGAKTNSLKVTFMLVCKLAPTNQCLHTACSMVTLFFGSKFV